VEKLTETLGVRVSADLHLVIKQIAEMNGMTPGEWVRVLIEQALQSEKQRYEALRLIFDHDEGQANNSMASRG
jgi:hypothetical protein